jgi:vacuolar-type H+-ATPase subunit E/Vma4
LSVDVARDALLADARASAERIVAEADAEARERVEAARRTAAELIAQGRARGEAEGRLIAAREAAQHEALARRQVLTARGAAYEELRRRASTAVLTLRQEAGYADLLERLAEAARRDLGDNADLEIDPPDAGGVRARTSTRLVDDTLPALAAACVEALGPRVSRLWE